MIQRIAIARHETGFYYRDGIFQDVLDPGIHWILEPLRPVEVRRITHQAPKITFPDVETLALEPRVAARTVVHRIKDTERGLMYRDDVFTGFLGPGFHAFLETPIPFRVEVVNIDDLAVVHPDVRTLATHPEGSRHIQTIEVPEGHRAALQVEGVIHAILEPGRYHYWTGRRSIQAVILDIREQILEVAGQELMTQDKVTIRVNLTARYRLTDVRLALSTQKGHEATLYRELQLALREEIGARTLDDLLARKEDIGPGVVERARNQIEGTGLELRAAGMKDIILPGDMRQILNQVLEAEKRAQANMITRREETAATRSLLNTARLLENNPLLLRLKELESVERIAEKIGSLSVYGGLDGLLKALGDAARLRDVPPARADPGETGPAGA